MLKTHNWKVVTYDKNDAVLESYTITNRTESEAFSEAESDVNRDSRVNDWTLTAITKIADSIARVGRSPGSDNPV